MSIVETEALRPSVAAEPSILNPSTNGSHARTNGASRSAIPLVLPKDELRDEPGVSRPMTWQEYLDMTPECQPMDIVDGWKQYHYHYQTEDSEVASSPTLLHQRYVRRVLRVLETFGDIPGRGEPFTGPLDVLVQKEPKVRIRQPDVMFLSAERLRQQIGSFGYVPVDPAPELIVEVYSPSDRRVLKDEIEDYCRVDVKECWIVREEEETLEQFTLNPDGATSLGVFQKGDILESVVFSGLQLAVDDVFTS